MEQKMKKFGVNSTLLLTSLSLVACGGGGSEGYYNNEGSNNNTDNSGNESETDTSKVAESLTVTLQDTEGNSIQQAQDATKVQFAVKVLNADKGGIAEQNVVLNISDTDGLGVTSAASKVASGADGIAIFELDIPTIQADSGKVNLTATVEGTTIQQVYTLNIKKASVIVSDYNLSVPQGTVMNLPAGTADITVQVTDTKGGAKSGQTVELTLPEEMNGKFVISNGSSVTTDSAGQATFTITANANLTSTEINNFTNSSQELTFKLVDENQAEKKAVSSITFKDVSTVVNTLEVIPTTEDPIAVKGGKQTIRVYAKNSNGVALASKTVKLATDSEAYGVSLDKTEAITNTQGYAEFVISTDSDYPLRLTQNGIKLTATYADGNTNINGTATVQAVTSDETADDQEAIQRLEIASSYQMNASADSVTVSVKGVNYKGVGASQGKVTLKLNSTASANGVTFDGSATQDFANAKDGILTYTIKTNAKTDAAVKALVASGIELTFDVADNEDADQTIKIGVSDEVVSEDQVRYLTFDPIETLDLTKTKEFDVIVQAIGTKDDGGLAGQSISLKRIGLTDDQLNALKLTIEKGTQTTDENGYATFKLKYTAAGSEEQKKLALKGLSLQVASSNGKTQTAKINFVEPSATSEITLQSLNIDTAGIQSLEVNKTTELTVLVNAVGSDGKPYSGQKIGLGLNQAPLQNGAVIVGGSVQSTQNGTATFKVRITPKNASELANLVANGLTIAVSGTDTTISATRTVQLTTPAVTYQDIASLEITPVETSLSTLGGETRVKVVAKDAGGQAIPNTPISIALSSLTPRSRVSLSDEPEMTNSNGEAEFTVTVSEGEYDPSLIKNGIILAVVGSNLNNSDRVQQTSKINVTVPANALNPRLTADTKVVRAGETVKVFAAVKDELGYYNGGAPMRLSLDNASKALGITLSNDTVMVSDSQNVSVDLVIPKGITTAQLSQVTVSGSIVNPNGATVPTTLVFTVEDAVNPYHLSIDSNRVSLSSDGDTALVTVKLLDANEGGVANQTVNLAINDPRSSTSINGASELTTNEFGEAVFEVSMKKLTGTLTAPIAPITVTAKQTTANGATTTQTSQIQVHTPTALAPQLDLKIKASKDKLNVRGDAVEVSVLVTDMDGSSQAGKAVTLTIPQYRDNGAYIRGASTLESDENGWVKFTVVLDEALQTAGYDFVNQDLTVQAVVKDDQNTERRQSFVMDVVPSEVPNAIGSIAVSLNPTTTGSTDNGVYYTKEGSVQVVDVDGKPIANQDIVMDIRPTRYVVGSWIYAIAKDPWDRTQNPEELNGEFPFDDLKDWVGPNADYFPVTGITPSLNPVQNFATTCTINSATTTWTANGQALRVVRFIGDSDTNPYTATYRTDDFGRFDFKLEYPKANAHWVTVEIGAKASLAQTPVRGYTSFTLSAVSSDYASDGSYAPNQVSPYTTCTN